MRNPAILVVDPDPQLSEQVRRVVTGLRPRPAVSTCPRVEGGIDALREEGPFSVLVAGPGFGTRAGLDQLRAIRREVPGTSLLLAFERKPDANLQEVVRTGAVDLLRLPVSDDAFREAIERAIEVGADTGAAENGAGTDARRRPGRVLTVASASGGSGKTFLATNLAYFLMGPHRTRTCVVDLDLEFGELATALRLRPRHTISDTLACDADDPEELQRHVEEFLAVHDTGMRVLAAPKDPIEADYVDLALVTRVLGALQARFDWVVVDTPPTLSGTTLAALDLSEGTFVLATPDLPSLRKMAVLLNTFERLKVPSESLRLLINKAELNIGIDLGEVKKLFPQGFSGLIPYAREVSKSLNLGVPMLAYRPDSDVSRVLRTTLSPLLDELAVAPDGPKRRRRRERLRFSRRDAQLARRAPAP